MNSIQQNLSDIKNRIHEYEIKYHRPPHSVKLLAVTKKQSIEKIQQAINAGQTAFGENYLQEALIKINFFADSNIEWHFIGPIQSNKTKKIAENFSWVHSIDSFKIAKRLSDQRPSHLPALNICLEVNISHENSKSGVAADEIITLTNQVASLPNLKLRGLMTIPEIKNDFTEQRQEFHKLKLIYDELNSQKFSLDTLSMGMSNDLEAAIAEDATIVRVGTAIFGSRA